MAQVYDELESNQIIPPEIAQIMKKTVGFRNIAVHEYSELDWNIVFSICTQGISVFKDYASSILQYLD